MNASTSPNIDAARYIGRQFDQILALRGFVQRIASGTALDLPDDLLKRSAQAVLDECEEISHRE